MRSLNKYYRTFLEIDLGKLKNNYLRLSSLLEGDTVLAPVVKADAYGYGSARVAKALHEVGARFFIVATVCEAVELRKAGVEGDILVLGYVHESMYELLYEYDLTLTLLDREQAKLIEYSDNLYGKRLNVHINLDTGMKRLGFEYSSENLDFLNDLAENNKLNIKGIYTHFATADEKDDSGVNFQIKVFEDFLEKLKFENILVHMANSAAILSLPKTYRGLVRAGISLYGLYPSEDVARDDLGLEKVLSWYSQIISVRALKAGEGVSYGWDYVAQKDMKIATVSVGYADGYSRKLSNKSEVIVAGKKYRVIGKICMDLMLLDVSDSDVKVDDLVTLIGTDSSEEISIDELASLSDTINYEVSCNVSKRVKRVYK